MGTIQEYRQISCGCCTGREATEAADWGTYKVRTDQCVCFMHRDPARGLPQGKCSRHGPQPLNDFTA